MDPLPHQMHLQKVKSLFEELEDVSHDKFFTLGKAR